MAGQVDVTGRPEAVEWPSESFEEDTRYVVWPWKAVEALNHRLIRPNTCHGRRASRSAVKRREMQVHGRRHRVEPLASARLRSINQSWNWQQYRFTLGMGFQPAGPETIPCRGLTFLAQTNPRLLLTRRLCQGTPLAATDLAYLISTFSTH